MYPLTQSQLQIWTGQQLSPDLPLYNMALSFIIDGAINETIFTQAFAKLVASAEVMRTVFLVENEQPQQRVRPTIAYDFPVLDFSKKDNPREATDQWVTEKSKVIFDISQRCFDAALLKIAADKFCFYLNQHHLITDGWAVSILFNALADCYQNILSGTTTENTLANFSDYVQHETTATHNPRNQKANDYWQQKATTLPIAPELTNQKNTKRDAHSERVTVRLSKEKMTQLRKLTTQPDLRAWTTDLALYNIFTTLLFSLAYRLSGQEQLSIGTPAHNRSTPIFKNTPGLFIKIFPLSIPVKATDSLMQVFEKSRNENNNFLRYAQSGITTPALNRQFNLVLNYINVHFQDFNGMPVQSDWIHSGYADPGHHIRLQIHDFDNSGGLVFHFDLNNTVFDQNARQKLPAQFLSLIDLFITDRQQSVGAASPEEIKQIARFNKTEVNYPTDQTIISLFEKQVIAKANEIAIVFEDKTLTFQQLDHAANQLANHLLTIADSNSLGIGICLDRSTKMMIGLLGILKAGFAYVPIDPEYPADRIHYIIDNAKIDTVVSTSAFTHFFESTPIKTIVLDQANEKLSSASNKKPDVNITPEDLMYIIYTSGSTGRPKGVMNRHAGLVNRLLWAQETFQLIPQQDIVLQKTTFCFDVSVWELFWPLIVGVKMIFARPDGHKDTDYLKQVIADHKITTIHFVPPMLETFLLSATSEMVPSLRQILCSGEALLPAQVSDCQNKFPEVALHNLYGPTEAAIDVTHWPIPEHPVTTVPIGHPVANTKLYVLTPTGVPCGIGVAGELHLSGIQLAEGYCNQPELTAEKFILNPFATAPYDRLYKTGDLVKWQSDGNLLFLGRIDHQVKIRGFRIELGEIESVLSNHPQIQQCVVIASPDTTGNKRLVAYWTGTDHLEDTALQQHLRHQLPEYMVPAFFIKMEKIPLTSNGKIDRKALPAPIKEVSVSKTVVAPRNEFEEIIHEVWTEVLPVSPIGVHDNFINIGGDSLTGIKLIVRVNRAFEMNLPVNLIFQQPTIAELAVWVETQMLELLGEEES